MSWLANWFRRRQLDRDIDEELRFHNDQEMAHRIARGESAADASRAVYGTTQAREAVRDQRGLNLFDAIGQDIRYGVRTLISDPLFTLTAAATLALGIGVNTAIFSMIDVAVIRPLPYPDSERLVSIWERDKRRDSRTTVSIANLADYRSKTHTLAGVAVWNQEQSNLTGPAGPVRVGGRRITANFFEVLGVGPVLGRTFLPAEDLEGQPLSVILSHEIWQSHFGGDRAIIGRTVPVDGRSRTVVGVLPAGFRPPGDNGSPPERAHVYLPAAFTADLLAQRTDHEVQAVARLKPGVTVDQARADLDVVARSLAAAYPEIKHLGTGLALLREDLTRSYRTGTGILLGAVNIVLLIACASVANLMLVWASSRQREIAVRVALGATRGRIVLQLFVRSLLLLAIAVGAGSMFGSWVIDIIRTTAPAGLPRIDVSIFDGRILVYTLGISAVTSVLFGLLPAWTVSGTKPQQSLKVQDRQTAGSQAARWRDILLVSEVALSLALLAGGALYLKTFMNLRGIPIGFETERVLAATIMLPPARYPGIRDRLQFLEEVEQRVSRFPGVESVAFTNRLPLRGGWDTGIELDRPPATPPSGDWLVTQAQAVSHGFFQTLAIPLLNGRLLSETDREGAAPVAVVNQTFVRQLLGEGNPIGRKFKRLGPKGIWITVVGVVADSRTRGPNRPVAPQIYLSAAQTSLYPVNLSDVAIRVKADPWSVAAGLTAAVRTIDPEQPVSAVTTLSEALSEWTSPQRFQTMLLLAMAAMALALALVGIYGVVSYSVAQRRSEVGIRVALGASMADVVWLVMRRSAVLIGLGIAIGLAGAWAFSRMPMLQDAGSGLPILAAVAVLFALTAGAACILPARRAASIDPLTALRQE